MRAFAEGRVLHPRAVGPRPPTSLRSRAPPSTSEGAYGSEPFPSVSGHISDTLPSLSVSVTVVSGRLFLPRCSLVLCQFPPFSPIFDTVLPVSVSVCVPSRRGGFSPLGPWALALALRSARGPLPLQARVLTVPNPSPPSSATLLTRHGHVPCQSPPFLPVSDTLRPDSVSISAILAHFCHAVA